MIRLLAALALGFVLGLAVRRPEPAAVGVTWQGLDEEGDALPPVDPRTFEPWPPHDPTLVHVDNAWTVACERCQLSMALADRLARD
jgi:hypothetical protein